eukprot:768411-Hanusia_phi.AAC.7
MSHRGERMHKAVAPEISLLVGVRQGSQAQVASSDHFREFSVRGEPSVGNTVVASSEPSAYEGVHMNVIEEEATSIGNYGILQTIESPGSSLYRNNRLQIRSRRNSRNSMIKELDDQIRFTTAAHSCVENKASSTEVDEVREAVVLVHGVFQGFGAAGPDVVGGCDQRAHRQAAVISDGTQTDERRKRS